MVREARRDELDALLELYLNLHEEGIPEHDDHLAKTWEQIMNDPNHHIIVKEIDGKLVPLISHAGCRFNHPVYGLPAHIEIVSGKRPGDRRFGKSEFLSYVLNSYIHGG